MSSKNLMLGYDNPSSNGQNMIFDTIRTKLYINCCSRNNPSTRHCTSNTSRTWMLSSSGLGMKYEVEAKHLHIGERKKQLAHVETEEFLESIVGTIAADPIHNGYSVE